MGENIATMLILALLITAMGLMARATIVSNRLLNDVTREAFERAEDRAKSSFSIETVAASGTGITVTVKNTGATAVADFERMDFIVKYVASGSGATVIERLTYTESTLAADEWEKTSISPDNLETNVWNRTETLTITSLLSNTLQSASTGFISVGTPIGVARVAFFTVP